MNYNNRIFKPLEISENGEVTRETIFKYKQSGNILSCAYQGVHIVKGHLLGLVDDNGNIEIRYHQINTKGEFMTGMCFSKPEILPNGKIKLYENWKWTSGTMSSGKSILMEI